MMKLDGHLCVLPWDLNVDLCIKSPTFLKASTGPVKLAKHAGPSWNSASVYSHMFDLAQANAD